MKPNRENRKRESLMASTLLATAFVITSARSRSHSERMYQVHQADTGTELEHVRSAHRYHIGRVRWLIAAIDRRVATYFHCAIPDGLEPQDFDLSDLTH